MPKLVECRNCGLEVSREALNCPNNVCRAVYPSLSEEEVQRYYSHCITCNERLLINFYVGHKEKDPGRHGICPKCGQPEPIHKRFVRFPHSGIDIWPLILSIILLLIACSFIPSLFSLIVGLISD